MSENFLAARCIVRQHIGLVFYPNRKNCKETLMKACVSVCPKLVNNASVKSRVFQHYYNQSFHFIVDYFLTYLSLYTPNLNNLFSLSMNKGNGISICHPYVHDRAQMVRSCARLSQSTLSGLSESLLSGLVARLQLLGSGSSFFTSQ